MAALLAGALGAPDVRVPDLLFAQACGHGDPAALSELDAQLRDVVPRFVAHLRLSTDELDEVQQSLRAKLLTSASGRSPSIFQYSGRADFGGWLRVVAVREGLQLKRRSSKTVERDLAAAHDEAPVLEPVLLALKERYRDQFRVAFADAVASLDPEQRTILRFSIIDRLSFDQIGRACNVHAATVSRRLAQLRDLIGKRTAKALGTRLGLDAREIASVMRLIESQLDASVSRVLADGVDPAGAP